MEREVCLKSILSIFFKTKKTEVLFTLSQKYVHRHTCTHTHTHMHAHTHTHTHAHTHTNACMHTCERERERRKSEGEKEMVDSKRNLMMCFSGTDQSTRIDGNLQGQTASTGGSHSSMCYLHITTF